MDSQNNRASDPDNRRSRRNSQQESSKNSSAAVADIATDLDNVLETELGQFGRFQLINLLLASIPLITSAFGGDFIFTVAAIPHRCLIPECGETLETAVYNQESLAAAFPVGSNCKRYKPLTINGSLEQCPSSMFNESYTIDCDAFVYQHHNSVVYEFNLGCQNWLRVLAGTLHSIGSLLVLPITGYISDNWGRCTALVFNIFNFALIALIRAFSVNYPMFLVMVLLQSSLGGGGAICCFVLATEMVGPKYRAVSGVIVLMMFAIGEVITGSIAWLVQYWRHLLMVLYIPTFLLISYYWLLPESVRWLLSKKKYDKAKLILEKIALMNKKQISEKSMQGLISAPTSFIKMNQESSGHGLIKTVVKSRVLLRRVCTTPIWWVAGTFVYYGLSIKSTTLPATNMYVSFILTCAIEIPGNLSTIFLLDRIGRKATLSCGYFLSAICNIMFVFIPADLPTLSLIVFLAGKLSITVVMTTLYLYTSELYPTQFRHTLVAFSSMIGRLGSIAAPLMPVLADYWSGLPSVLFGGMGTLAGLLVLTQPETLGTKLPDTLAEAEALGKPEAQKQEERNRGNVFYIYSVSG